MSKYYGKSCGKNIGEGKLKTHEIRKFPNVLGKMTDHAKRLMDFPNPFQSMKVYDKSDSRLLEIYAIHDSDQFGALINFG